MKRAEIECLVKAAFSYALVRCVDVKDLSKALDVSHLIVEYEDFEWALIDIEPKVDAKRKEVKAYYCKGFVPHGNLFDYLMGTMEHLIEQGMVHMLMSMAYTNVVPFLSCPLTKCIILQFPVHTSEKMPLMSVLLQWPMNLGKTAAAGMVSISPHDFSQ
jgi:hypothetical protein